MDDDGNNGEDDGDIMIAIDEDEDEDDLLLQLLRCNFLWCGEVPSAWNDHSGDDGDISR